MSVAIICGSESDLPIMEKAAERLKKLEIEHQVQVMSAHRTPDLVAEFASNAAANGIKVIIAGAGGAAHLAGAVAARTVLPVIGVPIDATPLGGVDALYATVQMPRGVPVATVAINGAENAAILAAEILGVSDSEVRQRLEEYRREQAEAVTKKGGAIGFQAAKI